MLSAILHKCRVTADKSLIMNVKLDPMYVFLVAIWLGFFSGRYLYHHYFGPVHVHDMLGQFGAFLGATIVGLFIARIFYFLVVAGPVIGRKLSEAVNASQSRLSIKYVWSVIQSELTSLDILASVIIIVVAAGILLSS